MKKLLLIRHAKSSWSNPQLSDFERPLNGRGQQDAPRMGSRLMASGVALDLIISSPARRALDTASSIAQTLAYPGSDIQLEPQLYHASAQEILDVIRQAPERAARLAVFGHNPGFHDAAERLGDLRIEKFRTCAVACFNFSGIWRDLEWGGASLDFLDDPRQ